MAGKKPDPEDMDLPPINEWLVVELSKTKDELRDLALRHESVLHSLTEVCRRNDRMQEAGNRMRDLLVSLVLNDDDVNFAVQMWGEANV